MEIKLHTKGKILSGGRYSGWTIWIETIPGKSTWIEMPPGSMNYEEKVTGIYYQLYFQSPDKKTTYDDLMLNYDMLLRGLEKDGITKIRWFKGKKNEVQID
jgi:hypothetical protein